MKKLIVALMAILLVSPSAFADFDNNTQTLTSTSTSTATATNAGNGGAGGNGGNGGNGFGGSSLSTSNGGSSSSNGGASNASNGGNSYTSTEVRQYRIAPPVSIGAATGVDGMGITTPIGGASYNKGNRFNNALALYNLKAANGMDCSREVAIMERETQESCFLGILPIDTPFGLGQMKPLFHYSEPQDKKNITQTTTVVTKSTVANGNGGNLPKGNQV